MPSTSSEERSVLRRQAGTTTAPRATDFAVGLPAEHAAGALWGLVLAGRRSLTQFDFGASIDCFCEQLVHLGRVADLEEHPAPMTECCPRGEPHALSALGSQDFDDTAAVDGSGAARTGVTGVFSGQGHHPPQVVEGDAVELGVRACPPRSLLR